MKESCSVICFPPSAIAVPKLIVVVALGLFVCTHHPQGTNVFLNSYASCYVFTLGDADKRGMEKYCVFLIWVCSSLGIQGDLEFDVAFLFLGSKPSYE